MFKSEPKIYANKLENIPSLIGGMVSLFLLFFLSITLYKYINIFMDNSEFQIGLAYKSSIDPIKFNSTKKQLMIAFRIEDPLLNS